MNQIQILEENAISSYKGITRLLDGQYIEQDQVTWITTGRRGLGLFNGVLHTAVSRKEEISMMIAPTLVVFLSQDLPFFWVDWLEVGTPGSGNFLSSRETSPANSAFPPCGMDGITAPSPRAAMR